MLVSGFGKWGGGLYDLTTGRAGGTGRHAHVGPVARRGSPVAGAAGAGRADLDVRAACPTTPAACAATSGSTPSATRTTCCGSTAPRTSARAGTTPSGASIPAPTSPSWCGRARPSPTAGTSTPCSRSTTRCTSARSGASTGTRAGRRRSRTAWGSSTTCDRARRPHPPVAPAHAAEAWRPLVRVRVDEGVAHRAGGRRHGAAAGRVNRFTRGVAFVGSFALVGGNARREQEDDRAEIAVVDMRTLRRGGAHPHAVPRGVRHRLVGRGGGARRHDGFGANAARAVEQHRSSDRTDDRQPTPRSTPAVQLVTPRTAASAGRHGRADRAGRGHAAAAYGARCPRWRRRRRDHDVAIEWSERSTARRHRAAAPGQGGSPLVPPRRRAGRARAGGRTATPTRSGPSATSCRRRCAPRSRC